MSRKVRLLSAISVVALLLASCGGGDSSGRTKNSALCYATQEEKDAAVKTAQDAFDAAMGGGTPGDPLSDTTVPATEDSVVETEDSVVDEAPSDTVVMESSPADGGGYRRPAVRVASGGDTTVPPAEDGGEVILTPEQQQAQMDLEAAEAQPLCEADAESTSEVSCTATVTLDSLTDDCADGDVRTVNSGDWTLVNTAEDGTETVLAQGSWDIAALSADNPIIIPISYGGSGNGEEESEDAICEADVSAASVIFTCSKQIDTLVHVTYADGAGTDTFTGTGNTTYSIAENVQGYQFAACPVGGLDNVYADTCYLNTDNIWTSGNDRVREFTVPADVADAVVDELEIDKSDLSFEASFDTTTEQGIEFTYAEGDSAPRVVISENCEIPFSVEVYNKSDNSFYGYWGSSQIGESVCGVEIDFSEVFTFGQYFLQIYPEGTGSLAIASNVEFVNVPEELAVLPDLEFHYQLSSLRMGRYSFTLTEATEISFTASAGETCSKSQDDQEENGFADPELELYFLEDALVDNWENEITDDDNSGHGIGNCSAAWIEYELEPGDYLLWAEDDDFEGGAVTVNSSVELTLLPENDPSSLTFSNITAPKSYTITVPAGGKDFFAVANSGNSDEACDWENELAYVDPYLVLVNNSTGYVWTDDDSGEDDYGLPCLSSWMDIFLKEGSYTLYASTYELADEDADANDLAGFDYSFGMSDWALSKAEIASDPIPDSVPAPPALPVDNVKTGSAGDQPNVAIDSTVDSMVCNSTCIDGMFAAAGITDGTITVKAGSESVVIRKGQRKAVVPVGENIHNISVQATSSNGETVNLSTGIDVLPADVITQLDDAKDSGSESSMNWMLIAAIALIVVAGAGVTVSRKKKSA